MNHDLLLLAVDNSDLQEIKALIDKGVNINENYDEAFRKAICDGRSNEILELFIDNGADIHVYGDYPIRAAANKDHYETVQLLLDKGTNFTMVHLIRALHRAASKRSYNMAQIIAKKMTEMGFNP